MQGYQMASTPASTRAFTWPWSSLVALKISSEMIVDVIVEYGENPADRSELAGNIWVRQEGGLTSSFLMSIHLPAKQGETPKEQVNRIFASLNENAAFKSKLRDFVAGQLEQEL